LNLFWQHLNIGFERYPATIEILVELS